MAKLPLSNSVNTLLEKFGSLNWQVITTKELVYVLDALIKSSSKLPDERKAVLIQTADDILMKLPRMRKLIAEVKKECVSFIRAVGKTDFTKEEVEGD